MSCIRKRYKKFLSKKLKTDRSVPGFTKVWQPMYHCVKFTGCGIIKREVWQWFASPKELEKLFTELEFREE